MWEWQLHTVYRAVSWMPKATQLAGLWERGRAPCGWRQPRRERIQRRTSCVFRGAFSDLEIPLLSHITKIVRKSNTEPRILRKLLRFFLLKKFWEITRNVPPPTSFMICTMCPSLQRTSPPMCTSSPYYSETTTHRNPKRFCICIFGYVFQPQSDFQTKQIDKNFTNRSWKLEILLDTIHKFDFPLEMHLHWPSQPNETSTLLCLAMHFETTTHTNSKRFCIYILRWNESTRISQTVPENWKLCSLQYTYMSDFDLQIHLHSPNQNNRSSMLAYLILHFGTTTHTNPRHTCIYILGCVFQPSLDFQTKLIDKNSTNRSWNLEIWLDIIHMCDFPLEMHLDWPTNQNQSFMLLCLIMHFETTTHTN